MSDKYKLLISYMKNILNYVIEDKNQLSQSRNGNRNMYDY